MTDKAEILAAMSKAVLDGDEETAVKLANEALAAGANLLEAVEQGFVPGIRKAGDLWEEGEYFLPELITSAQAMKAAMALIQPALQEDAKGQNEGSVVIGTVQGDIHDIGKTLVGTMLSANGFTVYDEGGDVPVSRFLERVKEVDGKIHLTVERHGEMQTIIGTDLLIATGRVPNSDTINPEAAGLKTNHRGYIQVDDYCRTGVDGVFAVGDVNGQGAFTHTSVNDGEIFWDHYHESVPDSEARKLSDRIPTYAMFIDPPLGRVGMSEKEARASGRNVLMATRAMARISRAKEKSETAGLVKILVDADSEEFLGATILGVGGDEVINMFTPFMYTKQSYKVFRRVVLTHPTVAELMPWILDDLRPL